LTHFEPAMGGKWLQLLKELVPAMARVAFLYNPKTAARGAGSGVYVQSFESFATALAVRPVMLPARDAAELRHALDDFAREANGAVSLPTRDLITGPYGAHRCASVYRSAARERR
jgi:putative tryptophan/tyrosine transport system substrate-binding protein